MYRSGETSCSISAIGNSGARASGPTGSWVPGCSGGGGGEGRSGTTLYHCRGSSDSCRRYLTWWSTGASGAAGRMVINANDTSRSPALVERPAAPRGRPAAAPAPWRCPRTAPGRWWPHPGPGLPRQINTVGIWIPPISNVGMAVRLRRAEQVERNRTAVLDAARRVFLDRGYGGATVDAIAEEAGFSKGVVYSQFGSKADMFMALLEQRITERAAQNERIAAGKSV